MLLVDGDAVIFDQSLLQDSVTGGSRAVWALMQAVRKQYSEDHPSILTDNMPVIIQIYANLHGLAGALRRHSLIPFDGALKSFAHSFSNTIGGVDFVDVGPEKENADSKMRCTSLKDP